MNLILHNKTKAESGNRKAELIRWLLLIFSFQLSAFNFSARAQTTNAPSLPSWLPTGLTNVALVAYGTYAPKAPTKVGAGLLALYNFNDYVGAGPGIDWLGEFNMVSANVTLRYPLHPLSGFGYTNFTVTPLAIAALATPMSGAGKANGSVASVEGIGANIGLLKIKKLDLGIGYVYDNWTGAGPYSGRHHQIFIQGHVGF